MHRNAAIFQLVRAFDDILLYHKFSTSFRLFCRISGRKRCGSRPDISQKKSKAGRKRVANPHEHVENLAANLVENQVCTLQLARIIECGLYRLTDKHVHTSTDRHCWKQSTSICYHFADGLNMRWCKPSWPIKLTACIEVADIPVARSTWTWYAKCKRSVRKTLKIAALLITFHKKTIRHRCHQS